MCQTPLGINLLCRDISVKDDWVSDSQNYLFYISISAGIDCRAEPKLWYAVGGNFSLSDDHSKSSLDDPPAYLVDDEQTVEYTLENRDFRLRYAGAPMKVTHTDISDLVRLIADQYIQVSTVQAGKGGGG